MDESDQLVPVLAGLVVDMVWWLECRGDDELGPHAAVKIMESAAWVLSTLPPGRRARLVQVLDELAEAEEHAVRREVLRAFPFACGLVDEDVPPGGIQPWKMWVHPAERSTHGS